jgi:hypothetical protein
MSSSDTTVCLSIILLLALIPGRGCFLTRLDAPTLLLGTAAGQFVHSLSIIALIPNVVAISHISNR